MAGKQTRAKRTENFGKGKVTPVQVAFIVDRYLSDNNYTQTRSNFRTEASVLISKSSVQEAPKSLLSLGAMLDEYICLKEEKLLLDQEKCRLEQEKFRVQTLLRGMQDVMNAYNLGTINPTSEMILSTAPNTAAMIPQIDPTSGFPAGFPVYNTPIMMSAFRPPNTSTNSIKSSTPVTTQPTSKRRKGSIDVPDVPIAAKRSRITTKRLQVKGNNTLPQSSNAFKSTNSSHQFPAVQPSSHDNLPDGSQVQGSNVAKCLFNQPKQSPPTNSSGPKTPPRATSSQTDKPVSPLEVSSTANSCDNVTPQQIIYTNRTVISSEKIRVSPVKQIAFYSIERNSCVSMSPIRTDSKRLGKRDHVKGKLDFEGSDKPTSSEKSLEDGFSMSQSDKEVESFDLDLPNLDALGLDFSLSEFLAGFDLDGEGFDYACQTFSGSPDSLSGSINESGDVKMGTNQVLSEFSSAVTEILQERDTN